MMDAKQKAMEAAVQLCATGRIGSDQIVSVAGEIETYLTGEASAPAPAPAPAPTPARITRGRVVSLAYGTVEELLDYQRIALVRPFDGGEAVKVPIGRLLLV